MVMMFVGYSVFDTLGDPQDKSSETMKFVCKTIQWNKSIDSLYIKIT
jgi:phosphomevalonate kinase